MNTASIKTRSLTSLGALALAGAVMTTALPHAAMAQTIMISDGVFAPSDWTLLQIDVGGNGSFTTANQVLTGGNPNEHRRVFTSVAANANDAVWGLHIYTPASYDPSIQGAVTSVCYSEDAILFAGGGSGQATGMVIEQASRYYVGPAHVTPFALWTAVADPVLLTSNFREIDLSTGVLNFGSNPDFSAAGSAMSFGFFRANSTNGGAYTRDGGIDNWSVCVVPAPGCLALLGLGGALAIRRRR